MRYMAQGAGLRECTSQAFGMMKIKKETKNKSSWIQKIMDYKTRENKKREHISLGVHCPNISSRQSSLTKILKTTTRTNNESNSRTVSLQRTRSGTVNIRQSPIIPLLNQGN